MKVKVHTNGRYKSLFKTLLNININDHKLTQIKTISGGSYEILVAIKHRIKLLRGIE